MNSRVLTNSQNVQWKKEASSTKCADILGFVMSNISNTSIFIIMHKTQVHMDQSPQHKSAALNQVEEKFGNRV